MQKFYMRKQFPVSVPPIILFPTKTQDKFQMPSKPFRLTKFGFEDGVLEKFLNL
jgi:hypothetical protein